MKQFTPKQIRVRCKNCQNQRHDSMTVPKTRCIKNKGIVYDQEQERDCKDFKQKPEQKKV